jgi:hypothetical protein
MFQKTNTYIRVLNGVTGSLRLSEHRFLGVSGGVDEGVEFVIITSGTDVLNNVCSSPLMGDKLGEVVQVVVELQD